MQQIPCPVGFVKHRCVLEVVEQRLFEKSARTTSEGVKEMPQREKIPLALVQQRNIESG